MDCGISRKLEISFSREGVADLHLSKFDSTFYSKTVVFSTLANKENKLQSQPLLFLCLSVVDSVFPSVSKGL